MTERGRAMQSRIHTWTVTCTKRGMSQRRRKTEKDEGREGGRNHTGWLDAAALLACWPTGLRLIGRVFAHGLKRSHCTSFGVTTT
jgi:hypothetical protein